MATFLVTIADEMTASTGSERWPDPAAAMTSAVRTALRIAADDVSGRDEERTLTCIIADEDGTECMRGAVTISVRVAR